MPPSVYPIIQYGSWRVIPEALAHSHYTHIPNDHEDLEFDPLNISSICPLLSLVISIPMQICICKSYYIPPELKAFPIISGVAPNLLGIAHRAHQDLTQPFSTY